MYLITIFFLIIGTVNSLQAMNLRCYEDTNRTVQWQDNCHACVLFIDSVNISSLSTINAARQLISRNHELSIEELIDHQQVLEKNTLRQRRQAPILVHKYCQRQINGPLYGYNQTHCFCDSHQCNFNIQRCIYEVIAKGLFSCYHGSNASEHSLEIRQKCRSCRLRLESNLTYHYECLTFAEHRQQNQTHCTCQQTLCNRDLTTCAHNTQSGMPILTTQLTSTSKELETTRLTVENVTNEENSTDDSMFKTSTSTIETRIGEKTNSINRGETFRFDVLLLLFALILRFSF